MTPAIIETCAKCGARLSIEDHECNQCSECYAALGQDCGGEGTCHQPPGGCDGCEMEHTLPPDRYTAHTTKMNIDALNARSVPPVHRDGCDAVIGGECRCGRLLDAPKRKPKEPGVSLRIFRHCKEHGPDIYIESFIDRPGGESCPLCDAQEEVKLLRGKLGAVAAAFNGWANGGDELEAALRAIGRVLGPPWPDKGEGK